MTDLHLGIFCLISSHGKKIPSLSKKLLMEAFNMNIFILGSSTQSFVSFHTIEYNCTITRAERLKINCLIFLSLFYRRSTIPEANKHDYPSAMPVSAGDL